MGDFLSLRLSNPHWFPVSLICRKSGYPNQWMTGLDDRDCFLNSNVALRHHLWSLPSLMSNRCWCWRFFSWVKHLEREADHTPSPDAKAKTAWNCSILCRLWTHYAFSVCRINATTTLTNLRFDTRCWTGMQEWNIAMFIDPGSL